MRASSGALAKVCQLEKKELDAFLNANNVEFVDKTFYSEKDSKQIYYKEYDTFEVVRLVKAFKLKESKVDNEKYKVTQEELDEIPF